MHRPNNAPESFTDRRPSRHPDAGVGSSLNSCQRVRSAPQARSLRSQHAHGRAQDQLSSTAASFTMSGRPLLAQLRFPGVGPIRCSTSVAVVGCAWLHPTFRGSTTCRSRPTVGAGMSTACPELHLSQPAMASGAQRRAAWTPVLGDATRSAMLSNRQSCTGPTTRPNH